MVPSALAAKAKIEEKVNSSISTNTPIIDALFSDLSNFVDIFRGTEKTSVEEFSSLIDSIVAAGKNAFSLKETLELQSKPLGHFATEIIKTAKLAFLDANSAKAQFEKLKIVKKDGASYRQTLNTLKPLLTSLCSNAWKADKLRTA